MNCYIDEVISLCMKALFHLFNLSFLFTVNISAQLSYIQHVNGRSVPDTNAVWLSHEHILVDFIGAEKINPEDRDPDSVIKELSPFLGDLNKYDVQYFVDATPEYLGRDVRLLSRISDETGLRIITNTGNYGAQNNKFIPAWFQEITAEELAQKWIDEFEHGIDGTNHKPGFIKISIDSENGLSELHKKLVQAAALTHLKTGLSIASHTGQAKGLWPQLNILREMGVSPDAFIWVHAQQENDLNSFLKAAEADCWISLDGLGWELDRHVERILFAKKNGFLNRILISHDAGWFDPQKVVQSIVGYTAIFEDLFPVLKARGFTEDELKLLISQNPSEAFRVKFRKN